MALILKGLLDKFVKCFHIIQNMCLGKSLGWALRLRPIPPNTILAPTHVTVAPNQNNCECPTSFDLPLIYIYLLKNSIENLAPHLFIHLRWGAKRFLCALRLIKSLTPHTTSIQK